MLLNLLKLFVKIKIFIQITRELPINNKEGIQTFNMIMRYK